MAAAGRPRSAPMTNQVQALFSSVVTVLGPLRGGNLKAIAIAADRRSALIPDVPTFVEQGLAYETGTWYGLLAPAKTPGAIIEALHRTSVAVLADPGVRAKLTELGAERGGERARRVPRLHQGRNRAARPRDP